MPTEQPKKASDGKPVKVKLLKPHTHAGVDYKEGAEIEVSETDAKWLRENKIAE